MAEPLDVGGMIEVPSLPASLAGKSVETIREARSDTYLCCLTGGTQLCLPLDAVVRVFPLASLQPVPRGPSFLKGLINLGGTSIPVIDLAERVGLPPPERYDLDTSIVLCRNGAWLAGVIVQGVAGLATAAPQESQLQGLFDGPSNCLAGVAVVSGRQSLIVDIGRLLDLDFGPERDDAP